MNEVNLHIVRALRAEVQTWRRIARFFAFAALVLGGCWGITLSYLAWEVMR